MFIINAIIIVIIIAIIISFPLPVIVKTIFLTAGKLSMLLGFSRDILEEWARGCCVHVFLVQNT